MEIDQFASEVSQALVPKKLKHSEDVVSKSFEKSAIVVGSTSGSSNSDNLKDSYSDLSYHNDNDAVDDGGNDSDYSDNDDYMYDNDDDDDDDYQRLQAQFDNVDLPPGVEAPVFWLKDPTPCVDASASSSTSALTDVVGQPAGAETVSFKTCDPENSKNEASATSSSTVLSESNAAGKGQEETEDEVIRKFKLFKRFDTVVDISDHHFNRFGFPGEQYPKTWPKRIQEEWKILEKDLPDTIYVRVYETRMDLLRAIIVGPAGTPYHDGLFVFDVLFPPTYPDIPPMVYYYSGGLRINPNLYDCGKVCLSLLNTWSGNKNEMWMPKKSTMLQVLVSIQALILNANPFFNEPGYVKMYGGPEGEKRSKAYNEDVFILSLKTMMYMLRRPPKHFEEFVAGHFRLQAHNILSACKAYVEGAEIGSVVKGRVEDKAEENHSTEFKGAVARMMNGLITNFGKNGTSDCERFRIQAV
ncbi:E3-independent ubiquitin-conjugating enzyme E2 [Sarracenia purpurea var. burkii]